MICFFSKFKSILNRKKEKKFPHGVQRPGGKKWVVLPTCFYPWRR